MVISLESQILTSIRSGVSVFPQATTLMSCKYHQYTRIMLQDKVGETHTTYLNS